MYHVADPTLIGQPENRPAFPIGQIFEVGGRTLVIPDEPVQVTIDSAKGESRRRLDVIPPVSVRFMSEVRLFAPGVAVFLVRAIDVPPTYVAGEERALVNLANGGGAIPPSGTSRPFERGVGNRPTLVQNVETLAHLAMIRAMGSGWFRALGHPDAPGTMLVSLSGPVADPGVFEVPTGERLVEVIRGAGGATEQIGSVLVGGYAGTWLREDAIERATLDRAGMAAVGGIVGCGAIVALPASACGIRATAEIMRWLAANTAGQCGPCVSGLSAIATTMLDLWRGTARSDSLDRLVRWSHDVDGRGACRYPDGAVRFLRSALMTFQEDARIHARGRPCSGADRPTLMPVPNVGRAA
jgi:NADH:ubiquinone oxidoreductase subunit F (NADH-binding)